MPETHVVTISVEFADGRMPPAFSCELFRGDEGECRRLAVMIPGCSHDHRPLAQSSVRFGTIAEWEHWVAGAQTL